MARHRIRWTRLALDDLRAARSYIATDDPAAAARALMKRVRQAVRRLATLPLSGRVVPERRTQGYREVIVAPYRVVYEVTADGEVHVLRVWHGRRDPARM